MDTDDGAAERERWARQRVERAGKDWATHMAKFDGTVLPRPLVAEPADRYLAEEQLDALAYRALAATENDEDRAFHRASRTRRTDKD